MNSLKLIKSSNFLYKRSSLGFTLVELMVVISIIAILAVIGLTLFSNSQQGARNAKRQGDMKAIANAMESHYIATGNTTVCAGETSASNPASYCPVQSNWFSGGILPTDPSSGTYCYKSQPTGGPPITNMTQVSGGGCDLAGGWATLATQTPPRNTNNWTICASLEPFVAGSTQVTCVSNQQQ